MKTRRLNIKELLIEKSIFGGGILSIILVILIFVFVLNEAWPLLTHYPPVSFFFGQRWDPTLEPTPNFGLLPNLWGSFLVTFGSIVLAIPLGVASAVYISEVAPGWLKGWLKPIIELLATVPSVAIGFVGSAAINPLVKQWFNLDTGKSAMAGSIVLAFMAIPTITTISEDALAAVPRMFREGSLALGGTRWQTISRVLVPAARPGIIAGIMLGIGRAIGETIAVIMVTGNAGVLPDKGLWYAFTHAIRTITATIGAEAAEVAQGDDHYRALFLLAIVLFLITFGLNFIADISLNKQRRRTG